MLDSYTNIVDQNAYAVYTICHHSLALRDALAELGGVATVLGTFSFDENRDGSQPAVIKVVAGGEFTLFGK